MQGSWTKEAQEVLRVCREKAAAMGDLYTGTEHLLMALVEAQDCVAGKVLMEAGVQKDRLFDLVRKLVTPSPSGAEEEAQVYFDPYVLDDEEEKRERQEQEERKRQEQEREKEPPKEGEPPFTPRLLAILEDAMEDALFRGHRQAGSAHLLLALLSDREAVGVRLLHTMQFSIQKLYAATLIAMGVDSAQAAKELGARTKEGGSSAGTLSSFSRDLTAMAAEGRLDPILGREKEIGRLVQILCRRTKNNPCLVGEPGVGKTAIVEGLAQRITAGLLPEEICNRKILVLDMAAMVAGTKYRGEFEQRMQKVIEEAAAHPGILLFIDELHTIIGAGGAEGTLDAANILKPALSRGEIQIIGATTMEEYRKYIEKDAALERRFQPIVVEEPTREETVEILRGLRPYFERHHGVKILDEALSAAAELTQRYVHDRNLPDKAIDVMDEASAKVRLSRLDLGDGNLKLYEKQRELEKKLELSLTEGRLGDAREVRKEQEELSLALEKASPRGGEALSVDAQAVGEIISGWTKIPVTALTEGEQERLSRLTEELHKRVIGQEEAVNAVSSAVKRGRVGLKDPRRPIGSFLFLGPTGVGKTELSKALAQAVFGSEQSMVRIDMSEYMEKFSVSRLIGSPPGYVGFEDGGQLSEKVRRNPYCVLLFDEIEKAHPDVFNILLQVLDDGRITDSHGRTVDFSQTIIIMTSNAGATAIVEPRRLGFSTGNSQEEDYEHMKSGVMEEVKRIFRPEFLNRIDEIMVFHMLTREEIRKIVDILFEDLIRRCREQMQITLEVESAVRDEIAKAGYDPKFGARPLRRQIQTKVEDALATEILSGRKKAGDRVRVSMEGEKILFS